MICQYTMKTQMTAPIVSIFDMLSINNKRKEVAAIFQIITQLLSTEILASGKHFFDIHAFFLFLHSV